MNEVLQTNIFFVITSIAVVILAILCAVALVYIVKILRNMSRISDTIEREAEEIVQDVHALRGQVKEKGASVWSALGFIINRFARSRKTKKNERN